MEMSIFRSGRWCTALGALTGWLRPASHPELRPAEAEGLGNAAAPVPFDVEGVGHVPLKRGKAEGQNLKRLAKVLFGLTWVRNDEDDRQ